MAVILEQLEGMYASMDESLSVGILITSIEKVELAPVVAAIKTLADTYVKWETVTERLTEEWRGFRISTWVGKSTATALATCIYCS